MKMTGKVRALPDGSTEVVNFSEVNVVGLLAQLGARMINEVSNKMFEEFTANFRARLQQERPPETSPQIDSVEQRQVQRTSLDRSRRCLLSCRL